MHENYFDCHLAGFHGPQVSRRSSPRRYGETVNATGGRINQARRVGRRFMGRVMPS